MGFSRQECWSGLPSPSPGDLPNSGIEHAFLTSPAVADSFFTTSSTSRQRLLSRSQGQISGSLLLLFSCSVVSDSWQPQGLQHSRLSCPSLSPRVCSNLHRLSQSFLASGYFPMSQLFESGSQVLELQHHSWQWIFRVDFLSEISLGKAKFFIMKHFFPSFLLSGNGGDRIGYGHKPFAKMQLSTQGTISWWLCFLYLFFPNFLRGILLCSDGIESAMWKTWV